MDNRVCARSDNSNIKNPDRLDAIYMYVSHKVNGEIKQ